MLSREQCIINRSSAKTQYTFPKSQRFYVARPNTSNFGHVNPTSFRSELAKGKGKGFNSSANRFVNKRCQSVNRVDGPGPVDNKGSAFAKAAASYSFGVSRHEMKKMYVEEIKQQGPKQPGPGTHEIYTAFGDRSPNREGSRYSMRPKDTSFEQHLTKQRKLPGPGNYLEEYVNLAGKDQC